MTILDKILENLEKCEELDASEGGEAAHGLAVYAKYFADKPKYETILKWSKEMLEIFLDTCNMEECEVCKKEFPETTGVDNDKFCSQKCFNKYNTYEYLSNGDYFSVDSNKYVKLNDKVYRIDTVEFNEVKFNKKDRIQRGIKC